MTEDFFALYSPQRCADTFLHGSLVGVSSIPTFQGSKLRKIKHGSKFDQHWIAQEYKSYLDQSEIHKLSNLSVVGQIPSLFHLCTRFFAKNTSRFHSEDVTKMPNVIQDLLLVEVLSDPNVTHKQKNDSVNVFLSSHTLHLNFPVLESITDCTIKRAAQWCPNLRDLSLVGFIHLSDHCLEQISIYCRELEYLNLSFCTDITDKGVSCISQSCLKLSKWNLHQCRKVTYNGIISIAKHSKQLVSLDLTGTRFCEDSLLYLLRNLEGLETLILYGRPIPKDNLESMLFQNEYFDDGLSDWNGDLDFVHSQQALYDCM